MIDPKAIRKAIMTAKSIAQMIDPHFGRVSLPELGSFGADKPFQEHSPLIHEAYGVPMPEHFAVGGYVETKPKEKKPDWWSAPQSHSPLGILTGISALAHLRPVQRLPDLPEFDYQMYSNGGDVESGYADGGMPENPYAQPDDMGMYSHAANVASQLPQERGSPEQFKGMLLNKGVKPEEFEYSGFDQAFADRPQVTRDELAKHFDENRHRLTPVIYGTPSDRDFAKLNARHKQENDEHWESRNAAREAGDPQYEGFDRQHRAMSNRHYREHSNIIDQYKSEEDEPKYADYTLFGDTHGNEGNYSKNYREKLLTLPSESVNGKNYHSSHYPDETNPVLHLRMSDRKDSEGSDVLHMEELQSDWAQQGRKEGFANQDARKYGEAKQKFDDLMEKVIDGKVQFRLQKWHASHPEEDFPENKRQMLRDILEGDIRSNPSAAVKFTPFEDEFGPIYSDYTKAVDKYQLRTGQPDAPYVTKTNDWVDLGLKHALHEAASKGYDKLAWTPGQMHADRYDLSKHVGEIRHEKNDDGTYNLDVSNPSGLRIFDKDDMSADDLADHVGKEMAEKIVAGHGEKDENPGYRDWRSLSGLDLKVGGQGMREFYDKIVPNRLRELVKKHDPDAKLEQSHVQGEEWPYSMTIGGDDGNYHLFGYDAREYEPSRRILADGFKTYAEADDARQRFGEGYHTSLPAIRITPRMRESILKKGFPAYAGGGEVENYADGGMADIDPAIFREHLKRIHSPLSENPASVQRALQIAQSYRHPLGTETGTGSFYNIKQLMPANEVRATIGDIPGIKLKSPKKKSWEDFYNRGKGGVFINMGGDLSNFGRMTHINDRELAWPVDLHAGTKYMLEPNPGKVWANAAAHASSFENKIKEAEGAGKEAFGVFSPMGPTAVNSSHNMFDALMAQIPGAGIDKKDMRAFDKALKSGLHLAANIREDPKKLKAHLDALQAWPGLENAEEASAYARPEAGNLSGVHRAMIVNFMDKSNWRDKGFPEVGITRAAITDPELKGIGGNKIGHRVVKLSPKPIEQSKTLLKHSTYPVDTSGEYIMDVPLVQRHYAQPDVMDRLIGKPTKAGQIVHPYSEDSLGRATARKLLEEQKQVQPVNQRMLDSVMTGMENQEKYGFKRGGTVRRALMIAKGGKKK